MNAVKILRKTKWRMKKVAERMSDMMNSPLEVCASSGLLTLLACREQNGSLNKRFEKRDSTVFGCLHILPPTRSLLEVLGVK